MAKKRLGEIVEELDTEVLKLIKLSKAHGKSFSYSQGDINELSAKLSGYYDLTNSEIRDIDHFLKESNQGKKIFSDALGIFDCISDEETEREFLKYVSEKLFDAMDDDELKEKIQPETVYETIRNLGVVEIYRAGNVTDEIKPIPSYLLKFDENLAYRIIRNYFVKVLERCPVETENDFKDAGKILLNEYERLSEDAAR
jgi:hypothetical protein|tara:strand:- start:1185 stop:1781 length:597 start_codon:yes stop_codon:yes gene_type:complete